MLRNVNWRKTDVITPTGLHLSRSFLLLNGKGQVVGPKNVVEAEAVFISLEHQGNRIYRATTTTGDVWEVIKLKCNCPD
jgi:hypothetical protein